ncbi:ATP-binding cassette transporter abc4 OS=Schizosaccharomyces pombe (strain 972 / ATCC 24843) GN=abc4 PE=3 SV=1 [Rhizoctonia solani AG-1 IB]|uniref:ATP-binding cassette transporter abc4 n=1 Tax=Thanatephorus cucumeris (strain AG1-IB / isolate 7/3/14) TaxID=1108050 RepID=A0A0B7F134_THACB|nr:ATP-binding cassette transporter abc4 OS=Schizosaccharomyces pombe (strain 972 / ATCC 24843) GN=abc4 PE=3 SV=1 [Rhizoctonia solani AG-1 IB]
MSQLVLSEAALVGPHPKWAHSLLIPIACAVVSVVFLLLHVILTATPVKRIVAKLRGRDVDVDDSDSIPQQPVVRQHTGFFPDLHSHISALGGAGVFGWKVLRLLACFVLTALTIGAIVSINEGHKTIGTKEYDFSEDLDIDMDTLSKKWGKKHKKHKKKRERWFSNTEWIEISLCMFYTYTTLLAILALTLAPRFRAITNVHLIVLLLIAMGVYVWRDLVPLAIHGRHPADTAGGWLTWSRIGVLIFASLIVPLCIPRTYVPLDPKKPSATPNPEQTASLISLLLYNFLDPLVWAAYRVPKLEYEQLPPLADYDRASYLRHRGFDKLDPLRRTKQRHLFWGLMEVFWREYCIMAVMITIKAIMEFAGPVGIKYLLEYLQKTQKGEDPGFIRPWFWILWLFLGPVVGSIAFQWYIFITTGSFVRTEGMITQLLFEHSLRIRMVAEAVGGSGGKTPKTATPGNDSASIAGSERTAVESQSQPAEGTGEGESNSAGHTTEASNAQTLIASTSSVKPQDKEESKAGDGEEANLTGKINNLMSTDLGNMIDGRDFLFILIFAPVQITVSIIFLYHILGWSAVIGMTVMILSFPIPGKLAYLVNNVQVARMKKTDARVQTVTESMNVIRMIKLFGWEKKVISQVEEKREEELEYYKKRQFLGLVNMNINYVLPLIVMLVTYASHTLLFKQRLDAATVFSSIGVFDVLRNQLNMMFWHIPMTIQGKVSLDRINDFLQNTELLDSFNEKESPIIVEPNPPASDAIGFRNATFTWTRQVPGTPTPSRRNFRLHIDEEVLFRRGKINMIVGPTGCGKTSLLMALLGEMHFVPSTPESWFSLPRGGGVAYAAQEAWVQNETIRENILFGAEFDKERYKQVISQCGLERDLTLFDAGDQTEVGEKGMTLSGGQKARVSLARAIYSKAEIIILDDVLSALDVHTSRWIVDNCFRGDLVAGRTMIIVTHNVAMVSEVADFVISLGTDGRIVSQGSIDEAYRSNPKLKAEAEKDEELERKGDQVVDDSNPADKKDDTNAKKSDGKLMVAEEVAEGRVGWPALKLFLLGFGGFWFWVFYMAGFIFSDVAVLAQTYWLGVWARAYELNGDHTERVNVPLYLGVYGIVCGAGMIIYSGAFVIHVLGSVRASRHIHNRLITSVLGAPLRWLDSTPIGRVIARFTQDIRSVDGSLSDGLNHLVDMTISLLSRFIAVIVFSPIFTIPGAAVFVIGIWVGQIYIAAQLSVKREMSKARSPLFSHFGAALQGIISIRAYNAQDQFKNEALSRIDKYTRAARTFYNLNRWICIRMDALGGLFAAGLASYLVFYRTSVDASDTGFSLNMAVAFSGGIIWWVRILNEFEVQGNSLERIQDYVKIEQELESIMVLEAGKIVEFDSPAALLQKESGVFKSLVDESGDRDALYAMAKGEQ